MRQERSSCGPGLGRGRWSRGPAGAAIRDTGAADRHTATEAQGGSGVLKVSRFKEGHEDRQPRSIGQTDTLTTRDLPPTQRASDVLIESHTPPEAASLVSRFKEVQDRRAGRLNRTRDHCTSLRG